MSIAYSLIVEDNVARGYYGITGRENQLTKIIMTQVVPKVVSAEARRLTLQLLENTQLHVLRTGVPDVIYMCTSRGDYPIRICIEFLQDLAQVYPQMDNREGFGVSRMLRDRMRYFNDPRNDRIIQLREQMEDVKDQMIVNIENVMERGEELEELRDATRVTVEEAKTMRRKALKLKFKVIRQYAMLLSLCIALVTVSTGRT